MKYLIPVLAIFITSCSTINTDLRNAISFGEIDELNKYSKNIDKQLIVRLFRSPIHKDNCFIETHGVCQYKYFLSVSTYDEYPDTNIFSLNETGEIRNIKWLSTSEVDTAIIEIALQKYTKEALKNNPNLTSETKTIRVHITPKAIKEQLTISSSSTVNQH